MIRVTDLEGTIGFYEDALGMVEIKRETFTEGRFTLVFLGYGNKASDIFLELTYNWDETEYSHGTGYGHLALGVTDIEAICKRLADMNVDIVREPGPMTFAADETDKRENIAFIKDPDGYKIELIEVD